MGAGVAFELRPRRSALWPNRWLWVQAAKMATWNGFNPCGKFILHARPHEKDQAHG